MLPAFLTTHRLNPKQFILWTIGGIFLGFCILTIFKLDANWSKFLMVGMAVPFIALTSRDLKRFFIALMVLSIPINADVNFIYRVHRGGAGGIGINLIDLPALCLYLLWMVEPVAENQMKRRKTTPAVFPMLGFLAMVMISMINSVDIQFSLFETVRMFKAFFIFYYLAHQLKSQAEIRLVIKYLLIGLLFESALAFYQGFLGRETGLWILGESEVTTSQELDNVGAVTRIWGTFGSSNIFAFYLQLLLPIPIALLFAKVKQGKKIFSLIASIAGGLTLLFTLSRGGWIGFVISMLIVLKVNFSKGQINVSKIAAILICLLICVILFFAFSDIIMGRIMSDDSDSAYIRIPMMQVAWAIIEAHPFIGIGINNYTEVMRTYDPTTCRISNWFAFPVHNEFLLLAAETGIFGLFFFLMFVFALFRIGFRVVKQDSTSRSGYSYNGQLALGIMAGLVSFLLHCLGDFPLISYFSLFWVLSGLLCALPNIIEDKMVSAQ